MPSFVLLGLCLLLVLCGCCYCLIVCYDWLCYKLGIGGLLCCMFEWGFASCWGGLVVLLVGFIKGFDLWALVWSLNVMMFALVICSLFLIIVFYLLWLVVDGLLCDCFGLMISVIRVVWLLIYVCWLLCLAVCLCFLFIVVDY